MKKLILILCLFGFIFNVKAQNKEVPSPILFIYDASGSMWGQLQGKTKKEIASQVLTTTVNNLPNNQNIGLVAYGHRTKGDCNDVEFMVDINNQSREKISNTIQGINPLGRTPLARSATIAINSLKDSNNKATIILITDGIESCDGNICDVVSKAKSDGIDFKLHIVGFGLKEGETQQLKCAAKAGGGNYYDVADASGLGDVLTEATSETVDEPDDNFSVFATKNGEPVDAWVRAFKAGTKTDVDVSRTYRDTSHIYLPAGKYDIEVKPLEGTKIKGTSFSVEIKEGEIGHKTISFDGGKINFTTLNNNQGWDCSIKVKSQDGKVVGSARTYAKSKLMEFNAGVYDIELLALKIKGLEAKITIEDVTVESGKSIDVTHNFVTGIANLGVTENGELVDTTVSIVDAKTDKIITGGRSYTSPSSNPREFILNPGNYKVKLRGRKNGKDTIKWFDITVKEGESFTKMYDW